MTFTIFRLANLTYLWLGTWARDVQKDIPEVPWEMLVIVGE